MTKQWSRKKIKTKNVDKQTRKRTIDDMKGHSSDKDPKPKEIRGSKDVICCAKCRMQNAIPPMLQKNSCKNVACNVHIIHCECKKNHFESFNGAALFDCDIK